MSVSPIPEGHHAVSPYLILGRAAEAIEFYKKAFGAIEMFRLEAPAEKQGQPDVIAHAEIKIGDSNIMLAEECDQAPTKSPHLLGGSSIGIHLYVEDVDAVFASAIQAGATEIKPVADQFYGDRNGTLQDPFGHIWFLSTHIEDVTPEEINRRVQEMMSQNE